MAIKNHDSFLMGAHRDACGGVFRPRDVARASLRQTMAHECIASPSTKSVAANNPTLGASSRVRLLSVTYIGGTHIRNHATVAVSVDGRRVVFEQDADHALEAAFRSLDSLAAGAALVDYRVQKTGKGGVSAKARATVVLAKDNRASRASATNADTLVASVEAYVRALVKLS